ncbi:MAG: FAD/NAD(P)-binding protein [Acidimicrobiia bacterium]|nr:FAD/NAD(P)-binding protein [Acidimicrobiia bacterium]
MATATELSIPQLLDPMPCVVRAVNRETHDTITLEVEPAEPYHFEPGQITMVYKHGVGEIPISISSDPDRHDRISQTVRGVGAVSKAIIASHPGDVLGIRGPFGVGWPIDQAEGGDVAIIGGGIGLAPLRSIVYRVLNRRDRFGAVVILVGARTPKDIVFAEELREWGSRFDIDVNVTVDTADRGWHGPVGVVTNMIPRAPWDSSKVTAFVCGPEVMMRFTARALREDDVPMDKVYVTMERNMQCGVGLCGHCQWGSHFVCREGPVFRYDTVAELFRIRGV